MKQALLKSPLTVEALQSLPKSTVWREILLLITILSTPQRRAQTLRLPHLIHPSAIQYVVLTMCLGQGTRRV